jgi:hypothetical protein
MRRHTGTAFLGLLVTCGLGCSSAQAGKSSQGDSGAGATGGSGATSGGTSNGGSADVGGNTSNEAGGSSGATSGGAGSGASGGGATDPGPLNAQGCPTSQEPGTWVHVSDPAMKLDGDFANGPIFVHADPAKPSDLYLHNQHDGTWKSADCGYTWTKVSTGQNADLNDTGSQWYAAIDRNPNRDPETPPTLYTAHGYGILQLWKSTNGGVDWVNVWDNNIFADDGVTNISADVGNDIHEILLPDTNGPDHVLATLHSYWGDGNNNGVFETTNGGETWTVHTAQTFSFQPHADILSAVDEKTWLVCHGIGWPNTQFYRTTDGGQSWVEGDQESAMIGRAYWLHGSTMYAGTDFAGGAYKSTDAGATWDKLALDANRVSWVAATEKNLYVASGYIDEPPHIWSAPIDDDATWTDQGVPEGMTSNGANPPAVFFDGEHYVLVATQHRAGVWRYVEP